MKVKKYWELEKELANKRNHEIISDFLLNMKLGNRSEGTIKNYRIFLQQFFLDMKESF